ncbi:MAG: cyclic nucleotide-binding/CBS domain-containing protein [Alphaproteobacteria bacterium]|tara:strand:- start:496 stop:1011 length:516 start_codon:yes stop_codon:yes gene_type:complete
MKISERPEFKSKKPPLTFTENESVLNAVKAMTKDNFGSVVVVDSQNKIKGIVTERDLMKKLVFNQKNPKTTKLKDIMTKSVKVAGKDDNLLTWLRQMSNERFRHVPVVDKSGKLINIMSQGDFVSYTWPNLLYQVKEIAKENYFKANQVILIILSLLIYTVITTVLAIKLV